MDALLFEKLAILYMQAGIQAVRKIPLSSGDPLAAETIDLTQDGNTVTLNEEEFINDARERGFIE